VVGEVAAGAPLDEVALDPIIPDIDADFPDAELDSNAAGEEPVDPENV
jgi:hypothetical protein